VHRTSSYLLKNDLVRQVAMQKTQWKLPQPAWHTITFITLYCLQSPLMVVKIHLLSLRNFMNSGPSRKIWAEKMVTFTQSSEISTSNPASHETAQLNTRLPEAIKKAWIKNKICPLTAQLTLAQSTYMTQCICSSWVGGRADYWLSSMGP
jgi:hypothetical protein